MKHTVSDILEFLTKANSIGIVTTVDRAPDGKGYLVKMRYDWFNFGFISIETTYIPIDEPVDIDYATGQGETLNYEIAICLFDARISMFEELSSAALVK